MSASAFVKIWCDWPDCYGYIETHQTKVTEARKYAAKQGWTRIAGMFDFCGTKEKAEEWSTSSHSWKGHAEQDSHRPIIRPASKSYVFLSCSCGWSYNSPYSWERAGTVARASVDFRWSEHVKEVTAAEKKELEK